MFNFVKSDFTGPFSHVSIDFELPTYVAADARDNYASQLYNLAVEEVTTRSRGYNFEFAYPYAWALYAVDRIAGESWLAALFYLEHLSCNRKINASYRPVFPTELGEFDREDIEDVLALGEEGLI